MAAGASRKFRARKTIIDIRGRVLSLFYDQIMSEDQGRPSHACRPPVNRDLSEFVDPRNDIRLLDRDETSSKQR